MELNEDKKKLLKLLETCPVNQDTPQDCPLRKVRKDNTQTQLKWVTGLSEKELSSIFSYHNKCYSQKTSLIDSGG